MLLTAYPEVPRFLDLESLQLRKFFSGADVWCEGRLHRIANPWRHPLEAIRSFSSPVTTLADKAALAALFAEIAVTSSKDLRSRLEIASIERLRCAGVSARAVDRFFRPFFGGVFFDRELQTSSRMFDFTFKMFASGEAAVPALGMGQMAEQMASRLPAGTIRTGTRVVAIRRAQGCHEVDVIDTQGVQETHRCRKCVIATEGDAARELLGSRVSRPPMAWVGTTSVWYSTGGNPPFSEPILVLNGDGTDDRRGEFGGGPVNHLAVLSNASPDYAPAGDGLVSANIVGVSSDTDERLDERVRTQLTRWFGPSVGAWERLTVQRIPRALPDVRTMMDRLDALPAGDAPACLDEGLFVCGDHLTAGSIEFALRSGRLAGEAALDR